MALSIYLYVPNLIGYVRIIFAFIAFYGEGIGSWEVFVIFYAISYLLDAVDGLAARALNQSSRFGAVLDMVADRFCTNILSLILAYNYRDYFIIFCFLAVLDFVSHWYKMYASLLIGETSHKDSSSKRHWLVNIYYTSKFALFWICAAQECFYLTLYLKLHVTQEPYAYFLLIVCYVAGPIFAFKQFINCLQLKESTDEIVRYDTGVRKK